MALKIGLRKAVQSDEGERQRRGNVAVYSVIHTVSTYIQNTDELNRAWVALVSTINEVNGRLKPLVIFFVSFRREAA